MSFSCNPVDCSQVGYLLQTEYVKYPQSFSRFNVDNGWLSRQNATIIKKSFIHRLTIWRPAKCGEYCGYIYMRRRLYCAQEWLDSHSIEYISGTRRDLSAVVSISAIYTTVRHGNRCGSCPTRPCKNKEKCVGSLPNSRIVGLISRAETVRLLSD